VQIKNRPAPPRSKIKQEQQIQKLFLDSQLGGGSGARGGGGGGFTRWNYTSVSCLYAAWHLELSIAKSKKAAWYSSCQGCHLQKLFTVYLVAGGLTVLVG
jgi:hypothetical protein